MWAAALLWVEIVYTTFQLTSISANFNNLLTDTGHHSVFLGVYYNCFNWCFEMQIMSLIWFIDWLIDLRSISHLFYRKWLLCFRDFMRRFRFSFASQAVVGTVCVDHWVLARKPLIVMMTFPFYLLTCIAFNASLFFWPLTLSQCCVMYRYKYWFFFCFANIHLLGFLGDLSDPFTTT